jgi:hypothetical protein
MKTIRYAMLAVAIVGIMCLVLVSRPAAQQTPGRTQPTGTANTRTYSTAAPVHTLDKNPADAPTPRMSNGKPSLTGFWPGGAQGTDDPGAASTVSQDSIANGTAHELTRTADGSVFFDYAGPNGGGNPVTADAPAREIKILPPYKAEYMPKAQKIVDAQFGIVNIYDPNLDCVPAGVPRASFGGFVVSSPEATAILYESTPGSYYRIIYTDGRPHPTDIDTSYMGHSIGHWDGDTLVVDTTSLDDRTWLQGTGASLHSDKEHVIERWTRKGNEITIETTVEDPVMFTKPWVLPTKKVALMTGDPSLYGNYILPAMCNTNDKEHLRVFANTGDPKDKYVCNWCNVDAVYGGEKGVTTQGRELPKGASSATDAGKATK